MTFIQMMNLSAILVFCLYIIYVIRLKIHICNLFFIFLPFQGTKRQRRYYVTVFSRRNGLTYHPYLMIQVMSLLHVHTVAVYLYQVVG